MFILPRGIRRRGPGKTNRRLHQRQPGRKHRATSPKEVVKLGERSFWEKARVSDYMEQKNKTLTSNRERTLSRCLRGPYALSGIDITRGRAGDIDLALITSENLFMVMDV